MHQQLPKEIDPFRFAHQGIQLKGEIAISDMPRLSEIVIDNTGTVAVDLRFDIDETGTPFMKGIFTTTVSLTCERCMGPLQLPMTIHSLLGIIRHEGKVEGLAAQYDPWIIEDAKQINPIQMVEDEIILSLPLIPKHEEACLPEQVWQSGEIETDIEKPVSPFAVLSALKTNK